MNKQILTAATLSLLALPLTPAIAQDEEPEFDGGRNCIQLRMVRRTEVVDDRNILFYMPGSRVYHNILPRQCGGLKRQDRFSYVTHSGSLCNTDTIRVLYDDGLGLREGNHCQLGLFHETTEEDARAIIEHTQEGPEAQPVPLPEPQEVGAEEPAEPENG